VAAGPGDHKLWSPGLLELTEHIERNLDRQHRLQPWGLPWERVVRKSDPALGSNAPGQEVASVLEAVGDDRLTAAGFVR
jgi:hypothetical protein